MEALENQKRILFIQTAFLGDAILSLPACEALKEKYPDSFLSVLCTPNIQEIFANCPFVDETLELDKRKNQKSVFSLIKFAKAIKQKNFDFIYSAHRSLRTSIIVLLSEVKETFGFSNSAMKFVYKTIVEYRKDYHEVQRNLNLVHYPDKVEDWKKLPKIKTNDEVKSRVDKILFEFKDKKKIAIAPGSVWFTKKYPADKFSIVAEKLANMNFQILLIGSKSDKKLCESIKSNQNNIINLAGEFSLVETIKFLSKCNLLISNDSAPTHMGVCADIPVLTIYCSTVPEFGFYPYNNFSDYISMNELNCKPCGIHGYNDCPLSHFKCANELSEEIIIEKSLEMIKRSEEYHNQV